MKQNNQTLLSKALPSFAAEFRQLLEAQGEPESAAQMPGLVILDRCRCGDDFCATPYTQPKPEDSYGPGHRNVALTSEDGMLILDVVGGKNACVEVLYRDEVRQKLLSALP